MAALRPECKTTSKSATVVGGSAYYAIHAAVEHEDGLIHGKLHEKGAHCAIGSYFATHETAALPSDFIDEVAGVNDAVPWMTPKQRKTFVLRWLKWKLTKLGMPGFRTRQPPRTTTDG